MSGRTPYFLSHWTPSTGGESLPLGQAHHTILKNGATGEMFYIADADTSLHALVTHLATKDEDAFYNLLGKNGFCIAPVSGLPRRVTDGTILDALNPKFTGEFKFVLLSRRDEAVKMSGRFYTFSPANKGVLPLIKRMPMRAPQSARIAAQQPQSPHRFTSNVFRGYYEGASVDADPRCVLVIAGMKQKIPFNEILHQLSEVVPEPPVPEEAKEAQEEAQEEAQPAQEPQQEAQQEPAQEEPAQEEPVQEPAQEPAQPSKGMAALQAAMVLVASEVNEAKAAQDSKRKAHAATQSAYEDEKSKHEATRRLHGELMVTHSACITNMGNTIKKEKAKHAGTKRKLAAVGKVAKRAKVELTAVKAELETVKEKLAAAEAKWAAAKAMFDA